MSCDVCEGLGRYPIFNKYGTELYSISCPECDGTGLSDEEFEAKSERQYWQQRYDAAMAEKRRTNVE